MLACIGEFQALSIDEHTRESVLAAVQAGEALENQKLKGIDLSGADLQNARFAGTHFRYSDLSRANLRGADLRGANLRHVNLKGADLSGADLREADLNHADISGAVLTGANTRGMKAGGTRGLSTRVFFTQAVVDRILGKGHGALDGEVLDIAARKERWRLVSAVRFIGIEAGDDVRGILHRVLTEEALREQGIDLLRSTAVDEKHEAVYIVEAGFLGEPLHATEPAAADGSGAPASDATPAPAFEGVEQKKSDQELINDFLLRRLTSS